MSIIAEDDTKDFLQCRLCAEYKLQAEIIHIKHTTAVELNLEYKIYHCLQLQFLETDNLPKSVCLSCCDRVGSSYEFTQLVQRAQETLRNNINEVDNNRTPLPNNDEDVKNIKVEPDIPEYSDFFDNDNDNDNDVDNDIDKKDSDFEEDDCKPLSSVLSEKDIKTEIHVNNENKIRKSKLRKTLKKERLRKAKLDDQEKKKIRHARQKRLRKLFSEFDNYEWKCANCDEKPADLNDLRDHYNNVHRVLPKYICNECGKQFDVYDYFKRHVRAHRDKDKYCCETCGRYFHKRTHLVRHQDIHSSERKYICDECGKRFKTSSSLRSHNRAHLPSEIKYKYECDQCNKKFSSKPNLICHKKLHTGIKEYTCHECGKGFMQKGNLEQHLNTIHSDNTPFKCDKCFKMFKTKSSLKTHLKIHSEVKPHACEVCGKRFRRKGTLTRHQSVHSDALPFECEYCKKCFRMKTFLKIHLRQHTGERPYSCLDCNHHFTDSSNYIKHMKGRHGIHSIAKIPVYSKKILQDLNLQDLSTELNQTPE